MIDESRPTSHEVAKNWTLEQDVRGHPYITSALKGRGVSSKGDEVREVA